MEQQDDLIAVSTASKILECSPDNVRRLERAGVLPAIKLDNGTRAFIRSHVEQLAAERAEQRSRKERAAK